MIEVTEETSDSLVVGIKETSFQLDNLGWKLVIIVQKKRLNNAQFIF